MKAAVILTFERDGVLRRDLKRHLIQHGLIVINARTKSTHLRLFQVRKPDLVIIFAHLRDVTDELHIITQIRRQDKKVPIIFIAKYSSEVLAIAALKAGVDDFFKTPYSYKELMLSIQRNLPGDLIQTPSKCKKVTYQSINGQPIVGDSKPMQEVKAHLLKVAQTNSTVLITGETGTGKELATKTIHCNSPRCKKPLVCINCAAIPDSLVESELFGYERGAFTGAIATKQGLFEAAADGTVFLDEIGDMTPFAQSKILRTIEMKETNRLGGKSGKLLDFRVIAATNQIPETLIAEKKFRKDLYYRLNVARVHMPPLRDRKEDIPRLIDHYIDQFNQRFGRSIIGLTEAAINAMLCYNWPGNVRELKNLVEVSFINLPAKKVDFIDLPEKLRSRIKTIKSIPESDRDRVISALHATKWNKSKAAQKLNWSRMTLYRKIAKYNITEKPKP